MYYDHGQIRHTDQCYAFDPSTYIFATLSESKLYYNVHINTTANSPFFPISLKEAWQQVLEQLWLSFSPVNTADSYIAQLL